MAKIDGVSGTLALQPMEDSRDFSPESLISDYAANADFYRDRGNVYLPDAVRQRATSERADAAAAFQEFRDRLPSAMQNEGVVNLDPALVRDLEERLGGDFATFAEAVLLRPGGPLSVFPVGKGAEALAEAMGRAGVPREVFESQMVALMPDDMRKALESAYARTG